MAQDAQHFVAGEVPLSPVEAQQIHAHRVKGNLSLGRGSIEVGRQEGLQSAVVEEPDGDFEGGEGLYGHLVQIMPTQVAVGRAIARLRRGRQARVR